MSPLRFPFSPCQTSLETSSEQHQLDSAGPAQVLEGLVEPEDQCGEMAQEEESTGEATKGTSAGTVLPGAAWCQLCLALLLLCEAEAMRLPAHASLPQASLVLL